MLNRILKAPAHGLPRPASYVRTPERAPVHISAVYDVDSVSDELTFSEKRSVSFATNALCLAHVPKIREVETSSDRTVLLCNITISIEDK